MLRIGRLHFTGAYYHVMGRGLERRSIFKQDADKCDFLDRLGDGLERTQAQCMAWALMSNHYHLLIRVSELPLNRLMAPLLGGYAGYYNRRYRRSGYVFQNRYKSILCDADNFLLELVRYIHLNPLKANIVKTLAELERYPWTVHAGLFGRYRQPWQVIAPVLALFSKDESTARTDYRQFVEEGLENNHTQDWDGGGLIRSYGGWERVKFARQEHEARIGDERILGDSDFVEQALREDELNLTEKAAWEFLGMDLETLLIGVCQYCGVELEQLRQKGRANNVSLAKALICYWGTQNLEFTSTIILADRLRISQPAISQSSKRGREYCLTHNAKMNEVF